MILRKASGWSLLAPAGLLIVVMFLIPLGFFTVYSFQPPSTTGLAGEGFTLDNYIRVFTEPFMVRTLGNTLGIAAAATLLTLALALPVALFMMKSPPWVKGLLIVLAIFPLFTGSVVRSIGWITLLGYSGAVNAALKGLGLVEEPLEMLQTPQAVTVVIVSIVLPAMILVLHAALEGVDSHTERAALSLGATPRRAFWQVLFPQIMPAVVTGTSLVFVLCVNAYSTPVLVGGNRVPMISPQIYVMIKQLGNLPMGAAMSVVAVVISLVIVAVFALLASRVFGAWRRAGS